MKLGRPRTKDTVLKCQIGNHIGHFTIYKTDKGWGCGPCIYVYGAKRIKKGEAVEKAPIQVELARTGQYPKRRIESDER